MKMLLALGTTLVGTVMMYQMPATPPMKMGLWETSVASKMSGMDLPPAMAGMANRNTTVHTCMTPESYAKSIAGNSGKDCTRSNEVWTGKSYSADIVCRNGKGHFEVKFDDAEHAHGNSTVSMSSGAHAMQVDAAVTMHYLGADCGKVTPEKPEIIMH